jgi:hypothetical protein
LLFLALPGDSDMTTIKERKRETTIALAIVRSAITIWEAIKKRSHEPIYKTYTKNEAKGLRAIAKLEER